MQLRNRKNLPEQSTDNGFANLVSKIGLRKATTKEALREVVNIITETPATICEFVQAGLLDNLTNILRLECDGEVLEYTCWVLTNIAAEEGEYPKMICDRFLGELDALLFCRSRIEVAEQALWVLGNIAGDSNKELCIKMLEYNVHNDIMDMLDTHRYNELDCQTNKLYARAVWTLSNLCRGKPYPEAHYVISIAKYIARFLKTNMYTKEIVTDALWTYLFILEGNKELIPEVFEACGKELLHLYNQCHASNSYYVLTRIIGAFLANSDSMYTQYYLDNGFLDKMPMLLSLTGHKLQDALWCLSNIAGGTTEQSITLLDSGLFLHVFKFLQKESIPIRREAMYVISNVVYCCVHNERARRYILQSGVVGEVCKLLNIADDRIIDCALETLRRLLYNATSDTVTLMKDCRGDHELLSLASDRRGDSSVVAQELYEEFFYENDEVSECSTNYFSVEPSTNDPEPTVQSPVIVPVANHNAIVLIENELSMDSRNIYYKGHVYPVIAHDLEHGTVIMKTELGIFQFVYMGFTDRFGMIFPDGVESEFSEGYVSIIRNSWEKILNCV